DTVNASQPFIIHQFIQSHPSDHPSPVIKERIISSSTRIPVSSSLLFPEHLSSPDLLIVIFLLLNRYADPCRSFADLQFEYGFDLYRTSIPCEMVMNSDLFRSFADLSFLSFVGMNIARTMDDAIG
ncbi:hypothetical protein MTR67_050396, partial [Solanum verrucosum]